LSDPVAASDAAAYHVPSGERRDTDASAGETVG
jgi:hypothetical protein